MRYFKTFLLDNFSKYFRENVMKLSETTKTTNKKPQKKQFYEKSQRESYLTNADKKKFSVFYFFGKSQRLQIYNIKTSKCKIQNNFYFCTFSNMGLTLEERY